MLGVLFDYQSGWRNLWDHGARPEQIEWNPHFSLIGAHLRLARQWVDGLIGPDLFICAPGGRLDNRHASHGVAGDPRPCRYY